MKPRLKQFIGECLISACVTYLGENQLQLRNGGRFQCPCKSSRFVDYVTGGVDILKKCQRRTDCAGRTKKRGQPRLLARRLKLRRPRSRISSGDKLSVPRPFSTRRLWESMASLPVSLFTILSTKISNCSSVGLGVLFLKSLISSKTASLYAGCGPRFGWGVRL